MVLSSLKQENVLKEIQETVVNERTAGVLADFVPPGFCPPGPNPLADIVPRTISASRY